MSESKHTPGPWGIDASPDKRTGMNIRTADPVYDGAEKGIRICRISRVPGTRFGRMAANARLIAAAPEMYEALRELQVVGPTVTPGGCWCQAWVTAKATGEHTYQCGLARAAIRKATGGEQ